MFRFLAILSIAATVGLQTWRTLFNNFAVESCTFRGKSYWNNSVRKRDPGIPGITGNLYHSNY